MATTYSLGVSNTTPWTTGPLPIKMGLQSNYATTRDDAGLVILKNKTSMLDQQEAVVIKARKEPKVRGLEIPVYNPKKVQDAVVYTIDLQDIVRATKDDGTVEDNPIHAWLNIAHTIDGVNTAVPENGHSFVYQVLMRLLGACFRDDGTERFDEFAKGAIFPTAD